MDEETNEGEPLFPVVPDELATLDDEQLASLIETYEAAIAEVTADPAQFVTADFSTGDLLDATKAAIEILRTLKAEAQTRQQPVELSDEETAAFAALASESTEPPAAELEPETAPVAEVEVEETVTAAISIPSKRERMPRPPASREPVETEPSLTERPVAFTAAGGARDRMIGESFTSEMDLADAIIDRHATFGPVEEGRGTVEKYTIAKATWKDDYPTERQFLNHDPEGNFAKTGPVVDPSKIKAELVRRKHQMAKTMQIDGLTASAIGDVDINLIASGGLCAPVTPYYNLQYISVPVRPVMGSLPSFMADRGGLRYARPAALSAVTTGVGLVTAAEDALGGTSATKTCQVIPCPTFFETDVDIIFHCLQFGNLGARTFPELVAQWNNLVLAAHARLAESNLLTIIDASSTQVTAGHLGLGASATLFSQIMAAANGLRSRNRMDPEAVLRLMLPWWSVDLIVSDVIRSQFQRFDTDQARVTALLRSFNIEPTFYIDSANGRQQVFGTQNAAALLPFPSTVTWYLFPEGSFIFLDSGMLELGIVRDSVLNKTNDFQIFGETFESVAFVGVESLAVQTTVCDSGTVSLPTAVTCPIDYSHS